MYGMALVSRQKRPGGPGPTPDASHIATRYRAAFPAVDSLAAQHEEGGMSVQIRRKLGTGARALEFMAANPFPTEPEQRVVLELKELITRGEELLGQVLAGESGAAEASRQRRALVETLVRDLLRPLSVAGIAASVEEPAVAQLRRVPSIKGSLQDIRVGAETMADLATRHREILIRHGLSPSLPDDLQAALAQFDAAMQQTHAGRRAHIGARAELADVGRKFTAVLRQLDGMNMYRYRKDAQRSAAWRSAKRVSWPSNGTEASGAGGGTVPSAA
jgi:hypothetical protein